MIVLWFLLQYTKLGLAMRAASTNPAEARLVGVRVTWMLSLGWGLAAVLGRDLGDARGAERVPRPEPDGGAPHLRVRGRGARRDRLARRARSSAGSILGVGLNLLGTYVDFVGADLRLPGALFVILVVLLVRPAGIFGRSEVRRV